MTTGLRMRRRYLQIHLQPAACFPTDVQPSRLCGPLFAHPHLADSTRQVARPQYRVPAGPSTTLICPPIRVSTVCTL
jgi:hypothetical protein